MNGHGYTNSGTHRNALHMYFQCMVLLASEVFSTAVYIKAVPGVMAAVKE